MKRLWSWEGEGTLGETNYSESATFPQGTEGRGRNRPGAARDSRWGSIGGSSGGLLARHLCRRYCQSCCRKLSAEARLAPATLSLPLLTQPRSEHTCLESMAFQNQQMQSSKSHLLILQRPREGPWFPLGPRESERLMPEWMSNLEVSLALRTACWGWCE